MEVQLSAIRAAPLGLTDDRPAPRRAAASCRSAASSSTPRTGCSGATATIAATDGSANRPRCVRRACRQLRPDARRDDARACWPTSTRHGRRAWPRSPPRPGRRVPGPAGALVRALPAAAGQLRYFLVHQIEESARHAGQSTSSASSSRRGRPALVLTGVGVPANDFFQRYVAAPRHHRELSDDAELDETFAGADLDRASGSRTTCRTGARGPPRRATYRSATFSCG